MTKEQIIKKIIAENPTPNQNLCPELWLNYYDHLSNGIRKNANTGEIIREKEYKAAGKKWPTTWEIMRTDKSSERGTLVYSPRQSVETCYMRNWKIEGENILEITQVKIDAHRGLGARDWEFLESKYYYHVPRIFLFEGDPHVYNSDGTERHPEQMKTYNHYFVQQDLHFLQTMTSNYSAAVEAKKFYHSENVLYPWNVRECYKRSVKKPKKANPMDDMANRYFEWPDLSKYPLKERNVYHTHYNSVSLDNNKIIQIIPVDGYLVIRNLERFRKYDKNTYEQRKHYISGNTYLCEENVQDRRERSRLVVSPKGEIGIYIKSWTDKKKYERSSTRVSYTYSTGCEDGQYVYIGIENLANIDKTKYLVPIIKKVSPALKLQVLVNALRHPVLEQLYKAGFEEIANYLNENDEIAGRLKKAFNVKEKKMPLNKLFDLNTYQMKKIEEIFTSLKQDRYDWRTRDNLLCVAKQLAKVDNFSSLSKETTDELFDIARSLIKANLWYQDLRAERYYWYRNRYEWNCGITAKEAKALIKMCKMCNNNEQNLRMYVDTIRLYDSLPETYKPNIDVYNIDNLRSLQIIHDDMIEITNVYREEYRRDREGKIAEGFKNRYPKTTEKYGENNGEFMIKAPERPAELTTEGSVLGHCVGGYLESVGNGGTTILFLRRVEFPSAPFYTIEVSGNDKEKNPKLIQIHGRSNCWLGNNPEAIPFVKAWLEKHEISYTKEKLLSTSDRYSCGTEMLDGKLYGL